MPGSPHPPLWSWVENGSYFFDPDQPDGPAFHDPFAPMWRDSWLFYLSLGWFGLIAAAVGFAVGQWW
jgi:hypothetical protein